MTDTDIPYCEWEMIQRAINGTSTRHEFDCTNGVAAPKPRWEIFKNLFCCGSTAAYAICYRYGYDPERIIGESPPDGEE